MSAYAAIRQAAIVAARFAWPNLHDDLVQWDEVETIEGDTHVTLSLVSEVDEDVRPVEHMTLGSDGKYHVELFQRALLNVDVRIGSVMGSAPSQECDPELRHFLQVARSMKLAWHTKHVAAALRPNGGYPVAVVETKGLYNRSADRGGVTLCMASYEVQFRALVGGVSDPVRIGRISRIAATGEVDGATTDGIIVGPA